MSEPLKDLAARERFRSEWQRNFAVSANAGSGKTTAISERLAQMALSPEGAAVLPKTAVVTYTKKAAVQIGQRARQVLLRRIEADGTADPSALDQLERAFFGTIHSFCLLLAQRYGQPLGLNLTPRLMAEGAEEEEAFWEEFLEQDAMTFSSLSPAEMDAFLRFVVLEEVFSVARGLNAASSRHLARRRPSGPLPQPSEELLQQLLSLPLKGAAKPRENLEKSKRAALAWLERFRSGGGFLPLYEPFGSAKELCVLAVAWMAPLKSWLADAAAALAAELADRYREFRFVRGVQTFADQIDAAMAVLQDAGVLDKIRADGWRVILDEAQDTDSQQFAVLVEIARPPGAKAGNWPSGGGAAPRAGHFCMVGDGQQAIYRSRADIRNFVRHLDAYAHRDGGEKLVFQATFRTPKKVIEFLNAGFPEAFGSGREYNLGLAPAEGVVPPLLQVGYEPLEAGPDNEEGAAERFALTIPEEKPSDVKAWLAEEARQLADFLAKNGPAPVGARSWGEICVLAPRIDWLTVVQKEFEKAHLETALQIRRNRSGDSPVYAWFTGLLMVVCDPENAYEWFGVLREIFGVSDALLAEELREKGSFLWETPEVHPAPLQAALAVLRPWILRVDDEGLPLEQYARGLAKDCALEEKAFALEPGGGLREELVRLLAEAARLGVDGAGPRDWLGQLLSGVEQLRPSGRPQKDAINLLSAHSSKGLEWPVVIPVALWHTIGEKSPDGGLYVISDAAPGGQPRVFFDRLSLPADMREARERERVRELVRLLYVTFTRASRRLIIPWQHGFGTRRRNDPSFAELFGQPERLNTLPIVAVSAIPSVPSGTAALSMGTSNAIEHVIESGCLPVPLPQRLLPHQLAKKADQVRGLRHESSLDQAAPARVEVGDEAIDYGIWWHETMEYMPWRAAAETVDNYCRDRLAVAQTLGFSDRAETELIRLRESQAWKQLTSDRWKLAAEVSVLSPVKNDAWIDGVIDLVLWDEAESAVWIVDWKTNRCRNSESDEALLTRLVEEYAPQLTAYGQATQSRFAGGKTRLLVYSSSVGDWREVSVLP